MSTKTDTEGMKKNATPARSKKNAATSNGRPAQDATSAARGKASSRRAAESPSEKKAAAKKALTIRAFQTAYDSHRRKAS